MDIDELSDFIFELEINPELAKDFGEFLDSNGESDLKQWLSHVVRGLDG